MVLLPVHKSDARSDTPVDVVLETGAGILTGDRLGAGAVGEQLLQEGEGLAHAARGGEGAEIACPVLGDPAGNVNLWERLGQIYLKVGVALVVLEPGVVGRPESLDKGTLEDEGLGLGVGDYELEVRHPGYHFPDLGGDVVLRAKIGADAVSKACGFAHVEDPVT